MSGGQGNRLGCATTDTARPHRPRVSTRCHFPFPRRHLAIAAPPRAPGRRPHRIRVPCTPGSPVQPPPPPAPVTKHSGRQRSGSGTECRSIQPIFSRRTTLATRLSNCHPPNPAYPFGHTQPHSHTLPLPPAPSAHLEVVGAGHAARLAGRTDRPHGLSHGRQQRLQLLRRVGLLRAGVRRGERGVSGMRLCGFVVARRGGLRGGRRCS